MLGLFFTCSFVIDTGSVLSVRFEGSMEIGEISTFRLENQEPASTTK